MWKICRLTEENKEIMHIFFYPPNNYKAKNQWQNLDIIWRERMTRTHALIQACWTGRKEQRCFRVLWLLFLVGFAIARPAITALGPLRRINVFCLGIYSLRSPSVVVGTFLDLILGGSIAVLRRLKARGWLCLLRRRLEIFVFFIILKTVLFFEDFPNVWDLNSGIPSFP